MKRADLEALGLEKDVVDKVMAMNGDDIEALKSENKSLKADVEKKDKTIQEHEGTIKQLGDDIDKLKAEGGDEVGKLKDKIAAFEKAEKERKEAEANALKDKQLTDNILEAIGDKEFVNDFTKKSIIAQIKEDLGKQENAGKGIKEIFEGLTKDSTDIFKNPQHDKLDIQPTNNGGGPNGDDDAKIRAVMGLPTTK